MKLEVKINGVKQAVDILSVPKNADGSPIKNLLSTMTNGVYDVDSVVENAELQEKAIAHYKDLYFGVVQAKLKELDYDSLATVKLWEGDATFGAEATRILTWYKAIIAKNYELLNAGIPLSDAEYLAQINAVVF